MKRLRVGVVGQGTAGTAAALFLSRAGHDVHVVERVEHPGPVGAGIILQPTGMAVLTRLGLAERVVARGTPLTGLDVKTATGRGLVSLDYATIAPDLYGLGIHRGALFQALSAGLGASHVRLETGLAATRIRRDSSGSWIEVEEGEARGPFDLVIIADGARSRVAEAFFEKRRSVAYRWGALWFVARDTERLFDRRLEQTVRGAQRMIGLLPTGLGPASDDPGAPASPLVSLFYSVRSDRVGALLGDFTGWRDEVLELSPRSESVLAQLRGPEDLIFTSYQDVRLRPFHDGSVVALGDAGHAMSPQLGQGANLALWDAMVLHDCIEASDSVEAALMLYSRSRRAHLDWFQWLTRFLTPFFQGDSRLLGWLRDLGMPVLSHVPAFERLMLAAMIGDTTGPGRRPIALPHRPPPRALPPPR